MPRSRFRCARDTAVVAVLLGVLACDSARPAPPSAPPATQVPDHAATIAPPAQVEVVPTPAAEPAPPSLVARAGALTAWLNAHPEVHGIVDSPMPMYLDSQGAVICYAPELERTTPIPGHVSLCWREPAGAEPVWGGGVYSTTRFETGEPKVSEGVHSFYLFLSRDGRRGAVRELRFPASESRTVASLPVTRGQLGRLEFTTPKRPRLRTEAWQALTPVESPPLLALIAVSSAFMPAQAGPAEEALLDSVQVGATKVVAQAHPTLMLEHGGEPGGIRAIFVVRVGEQWHASPPLREEIYEQYSALMDAAHVTGTPNTFMAAYTHTEIGYDATTTRGLLFFEVTSSGLWARGRIALDRVGEERAMNALGQLDSVHLTGEEDLPALFTHVALTLRGTPGCVATERTTLERLHKGKKRGLPQDFQPFLHTGALHWTAEGWAPGGCP